jgi:hypothetical protein
VVQRTVGKTSVRLCGMSGTIEVYAVEMFFVVFYVCTKDSAVRGIELRDDTAGILIRSLAMPDLSA